MYRDVEVKPHSCKPEILGTRRAYCKPTVGYEKTDPWFGGESAKDAALQYPSGGLKTEVDCMSLAIKEKWGDLKRVWRRQDRIRI